MEKEIDSDREQNEQLALEAACTSLVEIDQIQVQAQNSNTNHDFKHWVRVFTRMHKIPVFGRVWFYLFIMASYSTLVAEIAGNNFPHAFFKEAGAAAYGSVIMGLLLVFRTNTAYERWSEGRRLWGQLVNDSRNLCLNVRAFVNVSDSEKAKLGELVISFAYALKHHLRNSAPTEDLPGIGKIPNDEAKNLPVYVASKIHDVLRNWQQSGSVDILTLIKINHHTRAFMDICGSCERIKNSPIAVSYRAFMRQGIALNLLAMPWFLVPEFKLLWSLPVIIISTYFLVGLEMIAEDVEEPFGKDGDDLPLDNLCGNIRRTVSDILKLRKQLRFTSSTDLSPNDPLKGSCQ